MNNNKERRTIAILKISHLLITMSNDLFIIYSRRYDSQKD